MVTTAQPEAKPSIPQVLPLFQAMLPAAFVREAAQKAYAPKRFYERVFTPLVVVWCLVFQRLNPDHSGDAVVSHLRGRAADHLDDRHPEPLSERLRSEKNGSFCQARQRLPLAVLVAALRRSATAIRQEAGALALWRGHPVALLDGSTLCLYPQGDLVTDYGQHANQLGSCYWVEMRLAVAFCLGTGALLAVAEGALHVSEQVLARTILAELEAGSVGVGDQNFGVFSVAQAARHRDVFVLLRLTARRARALAQGCLHPGLDRAVWWWPSRDDQYDPELSILPIGGRLLAVHCERAGFRPVDLYFFTTLWDRTRYPVDALLTLYGKRWHVELNLRYVKATLDMEVLYARTTDTVRKELYGGLLAYNLIRADMSQAAQGRHLTPLALSFTMCWRRITDTLRRLRPTDTPAFVAAEMARLLVRLGQCRLPERQQFRIEPRAVRRRRNAYPPLRGSREAARQRVWEQLQTPTKS